MGAEEYSDKTCDTWSSLSSLQGFADSSWQWPKYCSPDQVLVIFIEEGEGMSIWARIAVTLVMMVLISFLAGVLWSKLFSAQIPSYIAGLVGGVVAIPVWEILEKFKPTPEKK